MKTTIIPLTITAIFIALVIVLTSGDSAPAEAVPANNVSVVDGQQIVEIRAKGGYQPRKSTAKADIPTIIRFDTNGTFDCSAAVRIPSMNISQILPQSGKTDIDVGIVSAGILRGTCGMGMYPFEVEFQA